MGTWGAGPTLAAPGFKQYTDVADGYEFSYPLGWVPVKVSSGPDVVFRDLIQTTENVSLVINPISGSKTLDDLGTPGEVGYRLSRAAIAPPDSGRRAELVDAQALQKQDKTYYRFEYAITLANQQQRHSLASAVVHRGKLYTLNVSTTEDRWLRIKPLFVQIIDSFQVN